MYADPESRTDCVASNGHRNARHMRAARAAVYFPVSCACAQKGHNSQMETATVSRLKNSLSAYLCKVRAGHSVVVYDRDIPIARIDRIEDGGAGDDRLALLAAQGITRPPEAELSAKRLRQVLLRPLARSVRLLDAVLDERLEGRSRLNHAFLGQFRADFAADR